MTSPLSHRLARFLFPNVIEDQLAKVEAQVDDSTTTGWVRAGDTTLDRDVGERITDLENALEAWRKNFMVRRIVTLTRSYVIGGGITLSSEIPAIENFIRTFWNHPKNRIDTRLGPICDALTRDGEIFPTLHTNKIDGISYLRFVPAAMIREILTAENDYETELGYEQNDVAGTIWYHPNHPKSALKPSGIPPVMLHCTVNRPLGATRGESDLTPILPWAKRYSEWLKDRTRLNRIRTRTGVLHIIVKDETKVAEVRRKTRTRNPLETGIYVSGEGQEVKLLNLNIGADDARDDGRALRLAIATGAQVGMHYLGEGESVNYATAKEMGEPTTRFYSERQDILVAHLINLTAHACRRYAAVTGASIPENPGEHITASVTEIAKADNESLAAAARDIVEALAQMKAEGWMTDEEAVRIAYKFAGEPLGKEEIDAILKNANPDPNGGDHDDE
jgi:hypothetical protein